MASEPCNPSHLLRTLARNEAMQYMLQEVVTEQMGALLSTRPNSDLGQRHFETVQRSGS